jgi:hypothetical protein
LDRMACKHFVLAENVPRPGWRLRDGASEDELVASRSNGCGFL